jgi:hypothetical protein
LNVAALNDLACADLSCSGFAVRVVPVTEL